MSTAPGILQSAAPHDDLGTTHRQVAQEINEKQDAPASSASSSEVGGSDNTRPGTGVNTSEALATLAGGEKQIQDEQ